MKNILQQQNIKFISQFYKICTTFSRVYNFALNSKDYQHALDEVIINITSSMKKNNTKIILSKDQSISIFCIIKYFQNNREGIIINDPPGLFVEVLLDEIIYIIY
jgi:hypothetical protein